MADKIQPGPNYPPVIQSLNGFVVFHLAWDVRYQVVHEPVQRSSLRF